MTSDELKAIRERRETAKDTSRCGVDAMATLVMEDIPKLLAEVERLRLLNAHQHEDICGWKSKVLSLESEVERLTGELSIATDWQTEAQMQEAYAKELKSEVERLREENERLRKVPCDHKGHVSVTTCDGVHYCSFCGEDLIP